MLVNVRVKDSQLDVCALKSFGSLVGEKDNRRIVILINARSKNVQSDLCALKYKSLGPLFENKIQKQHMIFVHTRVKE